MSRTVATISLVGMVMIAMFVTISVQLSTWNVAVADSHNAKLMTAEEMRDNANVPDSVNDFYPIIKERWSGHSITTVVNEQEASALAGFDVKFPTQMPSTDYELQLAFVNSETGEDNKYVFLYYSENPITNQMTFNQFWEEGGISVIYHQNLTMVRNDVPESVGSLNYGEINLSFSNLTAMVEHVVDDGLNAYETTINGHQASAIADVQREFQGFPIHDPTQVDFIAGNTHVTLQGYGAIEELIEIAESMPFVAKHELH